MLSILLCLAWVFGLMTAIVLSISVAEQRNDCDGFAVGIVLVLVGPLTFLAVAVWALYRCGRMLIDLARASATPKSPKENVSS
jgi:uncharacterized membrane protein